MHSSRVFFWGALTGARQKLRYDSELLYVAAMFHDTPEQNVPPMVLTRANKLALAAPEYGASPLHALRADADLHEAHLRSMNDAPRSRGQIDSDLAIARAKIAEAEHFDEAVSFLTSRETFAVLNSRSALQQLDDLPGRTNAGV